jgi:SAM-dependent methyltransferase
MARTLAHVTAFDAVAPDYDGSFGRNPIGLLFRHVVQARLEALYTRGDRVLDLGCGTGEDALALAARGIRVVGIDASPAMIDRARKKASERGLGPDACRFEVREAESLDAADAGFDGAYSNFGALNCADLPTVGAGLASALRPGAAIVISLLGPWPLPAVIRRTLTGQGDPRRNRAPRVGGVPLAVSYPTLAHARALLGPGLDWTDAYALGVLVPGPDHERWAADHPQALGLLAAVERAVRRWPGLRQLGDHVVLEGRRKARA